MVRPEYVDTEEYEGQMISFTADQLFSGERDISELDRMIYHVFHFYFFQTQYGFKVRDDANVLSYKKNKRYKASFDSRTMDKCWFAGEERIVFLCEPDD